MKTIKYIISLTGLIFLLLSPLPGNAEVAVIVNPGNSSTFSEKDIKRIFLGKEKKFSNGSSIIPINLASGTPTREAFETNVVGKSASKMKSYWAKLVFSGKGNPPKEVSDAAEAISLVANNPAVISYIDVSEVTDKVKVIGKF